jgi:hypothetical protein
MLFLGGLDTDASQEQRLLETDDPRGLARLALDPHGVGFDSTEAVRCRSGGFPCSHPGRERWGR